MANSISYADQYQSFIDEELVAGSQTAFMQPPAELVEHDGGKDIKIARIETSAMGDYDAGDTAAAFPKGNVLTEWDTYTFSQDRGVEFAIDRLDPSDSRYTATAENVVRAFSRRQLVREQDTYRINRVYNALAASSLAADHIKAVSLTASNILQEISSLESRVRDSSEDSSDLVGMMPITMKALIPETTSTNRHRVHFGQTAIINGLTYKNVVFIDDLPIIFVPGKRMQTIIQMNDGRTAGQLDGGVKIDAASKQISLLLLGHEAAVAAGKVDALKVFPKEINQRFDGTSIQARYVYDCWTYENQMNTVGALTES